MTHLTGNMLALLAAGCIVESKQGHIKFLLLYLFSGLAGNILSVMTNFVYGENAVSAGASGAIYGLFGALLSYALFEREEFRELHPLRLIIVLLINLVMSYAGTRSIDIAAHAGGLIFGFVVTTIAVLCSKGKSQTEK